MYHVTTIRTETLRAYGEKLNRLVSAVQARTTGYNTITAPLLQSIMELKKHCDEFPLQQYTRCIIVDESPNSAQCQKIIMAFKDGQWIPLRNTTTAGALNDVLTFVNELEAKKYVQATKGLELFTC